MANIPKSETLALVVLSVITFTLFAALAYQASRLTHVTTRIIAVEGIR